MKGRLIITNLGKAYKTYSSEWQRFLSWFGFTVSIKSEKTVLQGVSFVVEPGQALAIIGLNGAGKSTLLKLITGTLRATSGSVQFDGKIAAILELGMGFNPDLSGRDNVALSAKLMGFSVEAIQSVMPEILSFSEIGEAFEDPVRTYSSGMQMRVAFAVATAFRPDILILDEALSVGDAYFQHKSFDRIRKFREQGTTLLFVSHSIADVRALCDRAILLSGGKVIKDGMPDEVADYYNALIALKENQTPNIQQSRDAEGWLTTRSGSSEAVIERLAITEAATDLPLKVIKVGQEVTLTALVSVHSPIEKLVLGFLIRDRSGQDIWGSNTEFFKQAITNAAPGTQWEVSYNFICSLGPGTYSISPALANSESHTSKNFDWIDNMLFFEVINLDFPQFIGVNHLVGTFKRLGPMDIANGRN
jgi:lipopolysaccharide transport system ATP-binding protein